MIEIPKECVDCGGRHGVVKYLYWYDNNNPDWDLNIFEPNAKPSGYCETCRQKYRSPSFRDYNFKLISELVGGSLTGGAPKKYAAWFESIP